MCLPLKTERSMYIIFLCSVLSLCFFSSSILMVTLSLFFFFLSVCVCVCTFVLFLRPNPSNRMTEIHTFRSISRFHSSVFFLSTLSFPYLLVYTSTEINQNKKKKGDEITIRDSFKITYSYDHFLVIVSVWFYE